jgi:hypothetical protein
VYFFTKTISKLTLIRKKVKAMQTFVPQARDYMKKLMKLGGYSVADVAEMTESSVDTVKNFVYKRTTKNPGFDTIINWILALDGDLYEMIGRERVNEIESKSITAIRESCEKQLAETKEQYETRITEIKELSDIRVADIRADADKRVEDLVRFYEARIKEMKQAGM